MVKSASQQKQAEIVPADEPLPQGAKQVQRTTVERFTQLPVLGDADDSDVELLEHEDEEILPGTEPERHLDGDQDLSPIERLLKEFNSRAGSGGPIVIYAKRKPDPVGMTFRNPCNAERAVGEVPYDESDVSIEALELAIQKLYGGGRYQILLRQNGNYAGARTIIIADSPEKTVEPPPVATVPPVAPPTPPRSSVEELKSSVQIVREVADLFKENRPTPPVLPPPPTPDPLETMRGAINLVKEVSSFSNPLSGAADVRDPSAAREWMDGIAGIARELQLGNVINNLLVYGLRAAEQKRAQDTNTNGATADSTTTPAPAAETATPVGYPPLKAVEPPAAATSAQLPGGLPIEQLPPPLRLALDQALTTVVAELRANEASDADEYSIDTAVGAFDNFLQEYPVAVAMFDEILSQSSVRVLLFLAALKPEWSDLPDLDSAAGFLDELKAWWTEAKEGANEEENEVGSNEQPQTQSLAST